MRTAAAKFLIGTLAVLGAAVPSLLRAQISDPVPYRMAPGSVQEYGCFGPCACAVIISGPVTGSFALYRTSVDPLYSHYALIDINWTYATGDTGTEFTAHATGRGTYDIGGEVATMQRMTLDLLIDDPRLPPFPQHYDSGLVPVHTTFPAIDVETHRKIDSCRDSVFRVVAKPFGAAAVEPGWSGRLIRATTPNPLRSELDILFEAPAAGHARVEIMDLHGRRVASLLDGEVGAGLHSLHWNGHNAAGADPGAGIFWIEAWAGSRTDHERIVRLR